MDEITPGFIAVMGLIITAGLIWGPVAAFVGFIVLIALIIISN
jgi:hypothetical protein